MPFAKSAVESSKFRGLVSASTPMGGCALQFTRYSISSTFVRQYFSRESAFQRTMSFENPQAWMRLCVTHSEILQWILSQRSSSNSQEMRHWSFPVKLKERGWYSQIQAQRFNPLPRRDPQGQLAVAILYFRMTWIAVMAPGGRKSRLILNSNTDEELKRGYGSSSIFKIRATWESCRKVLNVQTSP